MYKLLIDNIDETSFCFEQENSQWPDRKEALNEAQLSVKRLTKKKKKNPGILKFLTHAKGSN